MFIFGSFTPDRHDSSSKVFSASYNNNTIVGRTGDEAGDQELTDLISMLVRHPECPKFICRKLYRWYVNSNVTPEIETQVITPLAEFFAGNSNNFAIAPVVKKLLQSDIFFAKQNVGAIIKSPAEFMIGSLRLFNQWIPDPANELAASQKLMNYVNYSMTTLQLNLLDQPSVFGSPAYYQTGFSKNWINETTIGLRGARTDTLVYPSLELKPGIKLGIDVLGMLKGLQPDFSDITKSPAISCEDVLELFSKNLFSIGITQSQKDFLIDSIMMMKSSPRSTWVREWDAYRAAPTESTKESAILWRCRALLKYMLRMGEFQLF
ncbi:DUF1800 family protein [Dyadobacter jiangsuensis]